MQCEFNAKKNQNQIEKRKKGEKIGSLCDPLACNLPLVKNKGPRFLQVDTMRQKYHSYTQNFHRNKINWKLSPKKLHLQL
jgi:hypothetical protein